MPNAMVIPNAITLNNKNASIGYSKLFCLSHFLPLPVKQNARNTIQGTPTNKKAKYTPITYFSFSFLSFPSFLLLSTRPTTKQRKARAIPTI